MNCSRLSALLVAALAAGLAAPVASASNGVYEDRLQELGEPANGRCDLQLTVFSLEAAGYRPAFSTPFDGEP